MAISREIKVGLFVLAGLVLTGMVVFVIGDQRHLFERSVKYRTSFNDVQGLSPGAPVRMNGINVGSVTRVEHSEDLKDPRIHVMLWVVSGEAVRIRGDARARIINKGLLGDKMLEIAPGDLSQRALPEGSFIEGEDPQDFANLASQLGDIATKTNSLMTSLDKVAKTFADDQVQKDFRGSMRSLNVILDTVATGDGYAHRILADPAEAERISRALHNFERTSEELAVTSSEIRQIATRVNRGPGFAHSIVYSDDGAAAMQRIGGAADEVATTLRGVREGSGLARTLLYGGGDGQDQEILTNLNLASRDLRDVVAGVKAGKGTVGALLVDPSVYEDMKVLLGNVERNEVLRALVRYSIKRDEARPSVNVTDPAPPASK